MASGDGAFGRFMTRLLGKAEAPPRLLGVHVTTRWGGDAVEPTLARLREVIAELAERDGEHPDAWMTHEASGWTLVLDEDGFARLGDPEFGHVSHLAGVSAEQALALWIAFAGGGPDAVATQRWIAGEPPADQSRVAARAAEAAAQQEASERAFYDSLGAERAEVPCRRAGCGRGAIQYSVLCRTHHCEQLWQRPCRFNH